MHVQEKQLFISSQFHSFSALPLLTGRQEEHSACSNDTQQFTSEDRINSVTADF